MSADAPTTDHGDAQGKDALKELDTTRAVYEALAPLTPAARTRVLDHVSGLFEVQRSDARHQGRSNGGRQEEVAIEREEKLAPKFPTFAELFEAAHPETQAEMALVAGYWVQVCQGQENFDSFTANRELKHLGHVLKNITVALEVLKKEKPALVLQLAKSGKSKQARKTYKLTVAGIKAVEAKING